MVPLAFLALASVFWNFVRIFLSCPPGLWWFVCCSASFFDRCFPDWPLYMALSYFGITVSRVLNVFVIGVIVITG